LSIARKKAEIIILNNCKSRKWRRWFILKSRSTPNFGRTLGKTMGTG